MQRADMADILTKHNENARDEVSCKLAPSLPVTTESFTFFPNFHIKN